MGIFDFLNNKTPKDNISRLEKVLFLSSDHKRYENGTHVSGPHEGGAARGIKIVKDEKNPSHYIVSTYNMDGIHPVWGNNIQMAPKVMIISNEDLNKIKLVGINLGDYHNDFSDYGLTVYFQNNEVEKCILHMFDRNVDLEYLK